VLRSCNLFFNRAKEKNMSTIKQSMEELMTLDGAMCAMVVDSSSGMIMGQIGSGVDLEVAAAGNTEVVRAKLKTMRSLGLNDVIEDILITLGKQYHLIRPMGRSEGVFIYAVLEKSKANLAMARRKVLDVEKSLVL
jgi:predicted regulator of Ras-like GTPase activity (Roadblock/LC7/MglB family)